MKYVKIAAPILALVLSALAVAYPETVGQVRGALCGAPAVPAPSP